MPVAKSKGRRLKRDKENRKKFGALWKKDKCLQKTELSSEGENQ